VLLGAGLGTSFALDTWAGHDFPILLVLATFGAFISYIYSAPPLKLKQNGWAGNYALGASYIALPWWAGQVGAQQAPPGPGLLALGSAGRWAPRPAAGGWLLPPARAGNSPSPPQARHIPPLPSHTPAPLSRGPPPSLAPRRPCLAP
jgi:hypothetical protein